MEYLLDLDYETIVEYLKKKYGIISESYFLNKNCKTRNTRITRTSEGLFIHHIDEDKEQLLSRPRIAINYPWEYQQGDRLVYCNLLEHWLLHIKITISPKGFGVGWGGFLLILSNIMDCLVDYKFSQKWRIPIGESILKKDNGKETIAIIKMLLKNSYEHPPSYPIKFLLEDRKSFYYSIPEKINWDNYENIKRELEQFVQKDNYLEILKRDFEQYIHENSKREFKQIMKDQQIVEDHQIMVDQQIIKESPKKMKWLKNIKKLIRKLFGYFLNLKDVNQKI
ncbi:hypothetical protein [Mycoplasmopsis pulmonis]|nr:hypothetical protein [Mycoplasmopsis pulmonis]